MWWQGYFKRVRKQNHLPQSLAVRSEPALCSARRTADLGQPRVRDAAFAGSFITRPYVPTSSGVMFVNTAAMCARARGEASNPAPGGEVKPWRWDRCRAAGASSAAGASHSPGSRVKRAGGVARREKWESFFLRVAHVGASWCRGRFLLSALSKWQRSERFARKTKRTSALGQRNRSQRGPSTQCQTVAVRGKNCIRACCQPFQNDFKGR